MRKKEFLNSTQKHFYFSVDN